MLQEYIDFSTALNPQVLRRVSDQLDDCFLTQKDELQKALFLIGVRSTEQMLLSISGFFSRKVDIQHLSIMEIEQLDLRKLAYQFLNESGMFIPRSLRVKEKNVLAKVFFKLGRLYLHEVLFPNLIDINPRLAYSVRSLLFRSIRMICRAEHFDEAEVVALLQLHLIDIPTAESFDFQAITTAHSMAESGYILPLNMSIHEIENLARLLFQDYSVICKKSPFINLINSQGKDIEPLEVPKRRLIFIVHLFYRMRNPYEKKYKPLITMNRGKAIWNFLQQNIIVNGITPERELRKLSSEINHPDYVDTQEVKSQVYEILSPIYAKQNPK